MPVAEIARESSKNTPFTFVFRLPDQPLFEFNSDQKLEWISSTHIIHVYHSLTVIVIGETTFSLL